jgi:hypothetical protein
VSGPSLETEAEALERRKVEALERIAERLAEISSAVQYLTDEHGVMHVRKVD